MNQVVDKAVVLRRQDFGEADRIVTFLTLENGKITGIVKGARRARSKMSGGIELFSLSSITFLQGKNDMKTIVSTRLDTHYGNIAKDVTRTMWAYEALKFLDKSTEQATSSRFYDLAKDLFEALNKLDIPLAIIRLWFDTQLLTELGHQINAQTDARGGKLEEAKNYDFSFETMAFSPDPNGQFEAEHIKLARLLEVKNPETLSRIQGVERLAAGLVPVADQALRLWVR